MRASIASALWAISAAVVVLAKPEPFWIGIYTCDSDTDYSVGDDCDPERGEAPQCLQPAAYREKLSKPEGNTPCPNDNLFPIAYVTLDADQQQAVTIHKQSTDEDMHCTFTAGGWGAGGNYGRWVLGHPVVFRDRIDDSIKYDEQVQLGVTCTGDVF